MQLGRIGAMLPKILIGAAAVGVGALVLSACSSSPGRKVDDVSLGVATLYDRGLVGADQARTGEQSLSLDGEQRRIVPRRVQEDSGAYTDGYRKFDEVQDISKLLEAADTNNSGDATLSEMTAVVKRSDTNSDGFLNREESAYHDSDFGPSLRETNVTRDRDLNGDGWDAVGDGIGILLGGE